MTSLNLKNPYIQYYQKQVSDNNVISSPPVQYGYGVGGFLSGFFRRAIPIFSYAMLPSDQKKKNMEKNF